MFELIFGLVLAVLSLTAGWWLWRENNRLTVLRKNQLDRTADAIAEWKRIDTTRDK